MSTKIFNSENWGAKDSDLYVADDSNGYLKTVRLRKLDNGQRVMYTQLFYPGMKKHSEHVFEINEGSDKEAIDLGLENLKWIAGNIRK